MMAPWIVFLIAAIIFFIIEIFTSTMFFLNFATSAIICAIFGIFIDNYDVLIPLFTALSIIFILFLKPLLNLKTNSNQTHDFEIQYINKQATATTDITSSSGRINLYDEDWEARTLSEDAPEIKKGSKVIIIRNDNLTMYVAKKGKK